MEMGVAKNRAATPLALPGDGVRQAMWRFADRPELVRLVESVRAVARGPVARLVVSGGRNTHEWTAAKAGLLAAFDESGISRVYLEPENGGTIAGPKNLALALVAFELAWVDAGAATASLAGQLALAPIRERGTSAQRARYLRAEGRTALGEPWRGAFCLTEPLPYIGVETGLLGGKVRVADWKDGTEPILQVDKRGRFITNMAFANFVVAAVDSADDRFKGSCLVILEQDDPGVFDRGRPARKLVHQLASTRDPVFSLRVPASRIVGGFTVKDGVIVPRFAHGEILEAVFRRTRITVALMTAAKLLSAIEPVLRYQRERFRGGEMVAPGSPRHELGLQQKEDALHRLIDVWATGEASAALGFAAARLFDELDPLERPKDAMLAARGGTGRTSRARLLGRLEKDAVDYLALTTTPREKRDGARYATLCGDPLVRIVILDAVGKVLCPAGKLWNTGHGANTMREAISLMGGYGITEDCPGFLGLKWMDAQLDAFYEGPEVVQRRQLSVTMTSKVFLAQLRQWVEEMRVISSTRPATGACALATAMRLWLWTLDHLLHAKDANGVRLYQSARQGVTFPLADALCWLLAARCQILDVLALEEHARDPQSAPDAAEHVAFMTDLCRVQAARAGGEVGRICAELVYGYNRHPDWHIDACTCYEAGDLEALEELMPGLASFAPVYAEVVAEDGSHRPKAGPCARADHLEPFVRLRARLDGCLTGARLAKDRAAAAVTRMTIPPALDYPRS
jgi:alkylation response protein AidB-like acyl-CoA dehydrogenase